MNVSNKSNRVRNGLKKFFFKYSDAHDVDPHKQKKIEPKPFGTEQSAEDAMTFPTKTGNVV